MIPLSDLIDFCRAEALSGKLYPTEISNWRWFCREYSKTFHTPLLEVLDMDAEHVILCVLEEGLDHKRLKKREDVDDIIEELRRLEDPDYDNTRIKEMDDWSAGIEEWEDNRVAENAPIPTKQNQDSPKPKEMPKEGGINLAYLAQEEEENPDNGFDEED